MLTAIFIILIVIELGVIGVIVVRKLPQLAMLDVSSIPKEIEVQKKKEILEKRLAIQGEKIRKKFAAGLSPVAQTWKRVQLQFRKYVGAIQRLWLHEQQSKQTTVAQPAVAELDAEKVRSLVQRGEEELKQAHYEQAEELFIAAIKIDQASALAYRGLADTYCAKGALDEASETYKFLLQLTPQDDAVLSQLADVASAQEKWDEAVGWLQQAVVLNDSLSPRFYRLAELLLKVEQPETAKEAIMSAVSLEPKNPKYLDLLLETVILCGDIDLAHQVYKELRFVNPENQKLKSFKDRIYKLQHHDTVTA